MTASYCNRAERDTASIGAGGCSLTLPAQDLPPQAAVSNPDTNRVPRTPTRAVPKKGMERTRPPPPGNLLDLVVAVW